MKEYTHADFILVDGSSYLFRAYHALPPLINAAGHQTGAIFGVLNMLMKLWQSEQPTYMAVVFDTPTKNFRHDLLPSYKANRSEMPDELRMQIDPLFQIIEALGFPLLRFPGYEADDVIGSLAVQAKQQGLHTLISTGDKDLAQLVSDEIRLVNTMSNKYLDREGVKEKFGVYPEQIVDYLALIGDSVDNIPGIAGVGPKTAAKWLEGGKTLNDLITHQVELKGKVAENFKAAIADLPLYQKINTVQTDINFDINVKNLLRKQADTASLRKLYTQFEFKSLLAKLEDSAPQDESKSITAAAPSDKSHALIQDEHALNQLIEALQQQPYFAFDTETTSLNVFEAQLVGIAIAYAPHQAFYIPLGHTEANAQQLPIQTVLAKFKPILASKHIAKIGHNLKYDINVLKKYDVAFDGPLFDTMLASYILNSTAGRHDLGSVAKRYLGVDSIAYETVVGKGAKQISFAAVPIAEALAYSAEDADLTFLLHQHFIDAFKDLPTLKSVYETIELPLMPVLAKMEYTGVLVDVEKLKTQGAELEIKLARLEASAHEAAGEVFNLNSPKQLQEILFEKLGIPVQERTATGQASTAESVLQALSHEYALPKIIIEYRQLAKLKSTYIEALQEERNLNTLRVHTSFHQAVTATGRLSSQNPNLQNIPIRTEEGRRIRQAFVAPKGSVLITADYAQIELKIVAHLSGDKTLTAAFLHGDDVHAATASEIFHEPIDQVTKEHRRFAKVINFGLLYGMSAFGLARNLGITTQEADTYMQRYFERFADVKRYIDEAKVQAKEKGYVETWYGRRLYLPDLNSKNAMLRNAALRAAVNAPMQGTAADLIKKAMIQFSARVAQEKLPAKLLLQVHDELVVEAEVAAVERVTACLKESMEGVAQFKVPLTVSIQVGNNWDEAH